jgi:hypothetical protein
MKIRRSSSVGALASLNPRDCSADQAGENAGGNRRHTEQRYPRGLRSNLDFLSRAHEGRGQARCDSLQIGHTFTRLGFNVSPRSETVQ